MAKIVFRKSGVIRFTWSFGHRTDKNEDCSCVLCCQSFFVVLYSYFLGPATLIGSLACGCYVEIQYNIIYALVAFSSLHDVLRFLDKAFLF